MNPDQTGTGRPALKLALGATIVSAAPILVKAASQAGVGPTAIALWRCLLGAGFAASLAAMLRLRLSPPRPGIGLLVLAGVAFALDLFVWHRSILLVGAGLATILASVQVFVTATLSALVYREPLTGRFVAAAVGALGGVTLLVGVGSEVVFTPSYVRGIAYGLATGLCYGVFLVSLRGAGRRSRDREALVSLAWFSGFAGLSLLAIGAAEGHPLAPGSWRAVALVVLLALLAQCLGWWTIARSLPGVDGAVGGLILLLQPVLSTIWSTLLFGESLEPLQWLGALVTLAAVYAGSTGR